MDHILTQTEQRDELIRQLAFFKQQVDQKSAEVIVLNAELAKVREEVVVQEAIRDRIIENEIPNIKRIVDLVKTTINS